MINYIDLLGKPFEWGGRGPDSYDCYGLCIELARRYEQVLPDSPWSENPAAIDELVGLTERKGFIRITDPRPGDLVGFRIRPPFTSHIGMIVNSTPLEFVHITKGTRVSRERIDSLQWQRKVAGYYRWNG